MRVWTSTIGFLLVWGWVASAMAQSRPTRIDFDDRVIKGQTAKAGSVYIYQRQGIAVRSLVKLRRKFRHKIIQSVFEK